MCINVCSLGSFRFLVTSRPPTVIADMILGPTFVILKGFPVSIFRVLQLFLVFRFLSVSSSNLDAESVSFLCCFSISCFSFFSIIFVAKFLSPANLLMPSLRHLLFGHCIYRFCQQPIIYNAFFWHVILSLSVPGNLNGRKR